MVKDVEKSSRRRVQGWRSPWVCAVPQFTRPQVPY